MPIVVACSSCNTRLKVPDQAAGKKVKCPKCAATIDVPLEEEVVASPAPMEPPASTPAADDASEATPKKSKKKLYITLGVVAGLLLSTCCCGFVGSGVAYVMLSGEKNEKVSDETFPKLKIDSTLADVEKELGPGKLTTEADVRAAYKNKPKAEQDKIVELHKTMIDKNADYRWRNGDEAIFVVFKGEPKSGGKAGLIIHVNPKGGGTAEATSGFWPPK